MEIRYTKYSNIIVHRIIGTIYLEELLDYIQNHIDQWVKTPLIWDLNESNINHLDSDKVIDFVERLKPLTEKRTGEKTAFFAIDDSRFGMIRMLESISEMKKIFSKYKSFRTMKEGIEWLRSS